MMGLLAVIALVCVALWIILFFFVHVSVIWVHALLLVGVCLTLYILFTGRQSV
jgi:hypothetical protein